MGLKRSDNKEKAQEKLKQLKRQIKKRPSNT